LALSAAVLVVKVFCLAPLAGAASLSTAAVGKLIFFDTSLSASGQMACASCHSPAHAYGPPDGAAVRRGGAHLNQPGLRAVPSLRYVLNRTPQWNAPYVASAAERVIEGAEPPVGGYGWDGRFNTLRSQAEFPLLAPFEMGNTNPEQLVMRLARAPYAAQFRAAFGADILVNPRRAYAKVLEALERFELTDPSLHPYSSRFDDYLDGKATLSPGQMHGLELFDDPNGGNCASCHLDKKGADGSHPLFTDYQFEALGVPRNPEIPANRNAAYFDEGLCGPLRTDQRRQSAYCGLFKTPTLRNVAARAVFFHNGRFHDLRQVLEFYVRRDTSPDRWYPTGGSGGVIKFDDLPTALRTNVDVIDAPLTRRAGESPVWNEADIDDVLAFLETLTDRDVKSAARR
jgi:cytochrome c peroxidase